MDSNELNNSLHQTITDFSNQVELTPAILESRRERICQLEEAMKTLPGAYGMEEGNKGNVTHHFGTRVYGRELFIPAGQIIVSKIHRGKTINVITKGVISVICPNNGYNTYEAPHIFVSEPYTKRIVISHEDTVWLTAHGTDRTNLEDVEEDIIAKSFTELMIENGGE